MYQCFSGCFSFMPRCKTCATQLHTCPSCGLADYEWHYCNQECLNNSPVLKEIAPLHVPGLGQGSHLERSLEICEFEYYELQAYLTQELTRLSKSPVSTSSLTKKTV